MTISKKHGGGLTLMRVLGDDLFSFTTSISAAAYPVDGFENIPEIEKIDIKLWKEPGEFRPTPLPRKFSPAYVIYQLRRLVSLPNPKYINWDYYAENYIPYLAERVNLKDAKFLVVPQNVYSVVLSNLLHRKFGVRYVSWVMDDHILHYSEATGSYTYPYPEWFESEFGYHLRHAGHVFTISDTLGKFYKTRFSIDYSVLFGPAEVQQKPITRISQPTLKLCHFGKIWKWSEDALVRFVATLNTIDATLDIFSHFPLSDELANSPRVNVRQPVAPEKVLGLMQEYDAVTIFYGFEASVRHWSEMNISTKMSECLGSGLPTIFVGPEYGAMTQWAKEHNCGIVITDPTDPVQIARINAIRNNDLKHSLVTHDLAVAKKLTSIPAMRQTWLQGWNKI